MLPLGRRRARGCGLAAIVAVAALALGCARAPTRPAEIDDPPPLEPEPVVAAEPEPVPAKPEPVKTPEPAAPDSASAVRGEAQDIVVELDDEERATLTSSAERDLREAERSIRDAERQALSAESRETLATVEGLLAAARDAIAEQDVKAAATLAHKARLLAAELGAN